MYGIEGSGLTDRLTNGQILDKINHTARIRLMYSDEWMAKRFCAES